MGTAQDQLTLEDRLRAVEDRLAIYQIIASHPPAADTGTADYYRNAFTPDGIMDLGGGKFAEAAGVARMVTTPEHRAAIAGGLCHFAGLPRVTIDGDRAVAISYLQIVTPNRGAPPVEVAGHGTTSGFHIHRAGANRWDLERGQDGWKVTKRTLRPLDGSPEARELLSAATAE